VQGEVAARQVAAAIRGFETLPATGPIPRPDVLVVARGGGSVEDLWPFNDEDLARAVAACSIPLVSAVGHETDTTLIDFVSDRRAPTPTGAAEILTPVRAELVATLADLERRRLQGAARLIEDRRTRLRATARGLPKRPEDLLGLSRQRLDHASSRLGSALGRNVAVHQHRLAVLQGRLGRGLLDRGLERRATRLATLSDKLATPPRALDRGTQSLITLSRALNNLNPRTPKPGFARVEAEDGRWLTAARQIERGQTLGLVFADGRVGVHAEGGTAPPPPPAPTPRPRRVAPPPPDQGDLF